jgi:ubiquitin-activating enzyme E1
MKMRISELVESIGKKPLAPGTTHLVVEMLVSDEEGEDVDVRSHAASTITSN